MRTELESGGWVEHLPIQELRGKHVRAYRRAVSLNVNPDAVDDDGEVNVRALVTGLDLGRMNENRGDAVAAIVITGWSFDVPVPDIELSSGIVTKAESLEELPADDLLAVEKLLAPYAAKLAVTPNPKKATTSGSSTPSRGSGPGSRRG